jgi:putative transposase
MLIRKAFKFRLEPTALERQMMAQTAGCVRLVWNQSLAIVKESLDGGGTEQSHT